MNKAGTHMLWQSPGQCMAYCCAPHVVSVWHGSQQSAHLSGHLVGADASYICCC